MTFETKQPLLARGSALAPCMAGAFVVPAAMTVALRPVTGAWLG